MVWGFFCGLMECFKIDCGDVAQLCEYPTVLYIVKG